MSLLSVWQVFALCASLASALPSSNSMANKDNGYVWKPPVGQTATHDPITTCIEPGMVALTYDDGPGPYTEQLLDILEANRVTATFFVNGNNNNGPITDPKGAKAIKEVYALGHHIGSHTWSHADLAELGTKGRRLEMDRLQDALSDIIGFEPIYMRPPYFSCPSACLRDMADFGYHVVG